MKGVNQEDGYSTQVWVQVASRFDSGMQALGFQAGLLNLGCPSNGQHCFCGVCDVSRLDCRAWCHYCTFLSVFVEYSDRGIGFDIFKPVFAKNCLRLI